MRAKITFYNNPNVTLIEYASCGYALSGTIYDILVDHGIDEETAINCAGWIELACDGESFEEMDFCIEVEVD